MDSNWTELELGGVINLKRGYDLPASKRKVGKIPIMSSSGINGYHNEEKVKGPGVITGRSGQLGKVFYIKDDYWPLNTTLYVEDFKNNYPKYVYYLLQTLEFEKFNAGSSVPTLNRNHVHKLKIKIPAYNIQKKIANILYMVDEKIQLNKEIVENLEEISQTLFKQWFIDFEFPNEEGKPYKSSGGEMIESELGDIPKNWVVNSLSNIAEIVMGQSPKSDTYNNEKIGLPLLNGATDFRNRMLSPSKYTSDAKKIGCQGDYVFGVRATIGLVTELDDTYAIGRGSGIAKALYPEQKEYLYEILNKAFDEFQYTASGSVYLNISKNDLMYLKICQPPFDIFKKYHLSVNTIIIQKENLKRQNKNLIQLRDALLPKLLSGEVEIPQELEVK